MDLVKFSFSKKATTFLSYLIHLDLTLLSNLETKWKITKKSGLLRKLKLYFWRIVFINEILNSISTTFLCGS